LKEKGIAPGEPYAVLQPGARIASMRWPVEKFAEIARWLRKSHGIASVVNLGRRDDEIAVSVRTAMNDAAVIADSFDARELIALIAGARLFVGNDSGPAHLAAATARPSVVIFGSTNPSEWRPWQTEHRIVHTNAVFESRRGDKSIAVRAERTIDSIGVDEVRAACEDLLAVGTASESAGAK
jgi:heptosyltransferase-2/heptosyltransferase-3